MIALVLYSISYFVAIVLFTYVLHDAKKISKVEDLNGFDFSKIRTRSNTIVVAVILGLRLVGVSFTFYSMTKYWTTGLTRSQLW